MERSYLETYWDRAMGGEGKFRAFLLQSAEDGLTVNAMRETLLRTFPEKAVPAYLTLSRYLAKYRKEADNGTA